MAQIMATEAKKPARPWPLMMGGLCSWRAGAGQAKQAALQDGASCATGWTAEGRRGAGWSRGALAIPA